MKTKNVTSIASFIKALFLIVAIITTSCKAKQQPPIIIKETATVENSDFARVKSELTRSLAINDSLMAYVGNISTSNPECDSVCQKALDRALQNLSNKKTSGTNSMEVYYDKYKKAIIVIANLQETVSQNRDSVRHLSRKKIQTLEVPVPAPYPVERELSKEQKISLYSGRIFWVLFIVWGVYRIRKFIPV